MTPPQAPCNIEKLERRCPRLGSVVSWAYCRHETEGRPCFKILDCWWERFDVAVFLQNELDADEFERIQAARPPSKVAGLLDLIHRVQNDTERDRQP